MIAVSKTEISNLLLGLPPEAKSHHIKRKILHELRSAISSRQFTRMEIAHLQSDFENAVTAHEENNADVARVHILLNPNIQNVLQAKDTANESEVARLSKLLSPDMRQALTLQPTDDAQLQTTKLRTEFASAKQAQAANEREIVQLESDLHKAWAKQKNNDANIRQLVKLLKYFYYCRNFMVIVKLFTLASGSGPGAGRYIYPHQFQALDRIIVLWSYWNVRIKIDYVTAIVVQHCKMTREKPGTVSNAARSTSASHQEGGRGCKRRFEEADAKDAKGKSVAAAKNDSISKLKHE